MRPRRYRLRLTVWLIRRTIAALDLIAAACECRRCEGKYMDDLIALLRTDCEARTYVEVGLLDFSRRLVTGAIAAEYQSASRPFLAAELTGCVERIIKALKAGH